MTTVLYGARAFDYIRAKEADIGTAATVIGVSKTAIAAFIAKENNSYVSTTYFAENISLSNIFGSRIHDRGLDLLAIAKSYTMTDAQIRADASQVLLLRYQDQMTSSGGFTKNALKAEFVTLADVGFSNIKVVTALRLIDKYYVDHPNDDPLNLRQYQGNASQLIRDLDNPSKPTVAYIATLGTKEAQDFYVSRVAPADWAAYSQVEKDALVVTYLTRGLTGPNGMEVAYQRNVTLNGRFLPAAGRDTTGGLSTIDNARQIGLAVGDSTYGLGVTRASLGYSEDGKKTSRNLFNEFSPEGTPLGVNQTKLVGNIQTDTFWTKDADGNYIKSERTIVKRADGSIESDIDSQYTFNSDGVPVSGVRFEPDPDSIYFKVVPLVPLNTDGKLWGTVPGYDANAAPTRAASATFVNLGVVGSATVSLNAGGTLSDIILLQNKAGNSITLQDLLANNPQITDVKNIAVGADIRIPQKLADGSITYNFAGGAAINSNAVNGEYHMVVPNGDGTGGQTVYSRTADDFGYNVSQVSTNAAGAVTFSSSGYQATLSSDIVPYQTTQASATGTNSQFYGQGGIITGQVQSLSGDSAAAQPATPSTDPISDKLQDVRRGLGSLDDEVLRAAELRAIGGAQSEDEAWGGAHVMAAGESALGEYYRAILDYEAQNPTNPGTGSTTATPALHLDVDDGGDGLGWELDWGYDLGLGLLGGFGLGGGAGVVNDVWQSQEGSYTPIDWGYVGSTTGTGTINAWNYDSYDYGSFSSDWGNWGSTSSSNWSYTDYSSTSYSNYNYTSSSNTYDSYDYGSSWFGGWDSGWGSGYDSYDWDFWAPVALDLDGDGIELVKQADSQAWYDVIGDGQRRHIGWLGKDDGFLAIDDNADGQISLAKELSFALWTADTTDTDLEALATVFDTNHDNVIDVGDARFADFRVWQDANGDGVSDAGELKTLAQAGMTSVALTVAQANWGSGGNKVSGFSSFTKIDGSQGWAADVALGYETQGWTAESANASNASPGLAGLVRMTETGGRVYGLATGSAAVSVDLGSAGLDAVIGGAVQAGGAGNAHNICNTPKIHYEKRSCLRTYLLGWRPKTYLKLGEKCSKRAFNRGKYRLEAEI